MAVVVELEDKRMTSLLVVVEVVVERTMNYFELVVEVERKAETSLASTLVSVHIVIAAESQVLACNLVDNAVHIVVDMVHMVYSCNFYHPFYFIFLI